MENNIKRVIESVDVPMEKLDAAILAGVQSRKKAQPKYFKKTILASMAASALILGSGFISPKMANVLANVPIVGFIYDIEKNDKGLQIALSDENKVVLNETVTSAGISVTFEEIVYDGERLHVIFSMDEYRDIYPLTILVDGETVNNAEGLRELESDGNFRGLWDIKIEEDLPEAFELTLQINYIEGIAGNWQITTPIQEVNSNRQLHVAGQKGQIDGVNFEVESIVTSNTSTIISVHFDSNMSTFFSQHNVLNATITDQHGNPIRVVDKRMEGTENETIYKYILEPLSHGTKELKTSFYYIPFTEERIEIKERLQTKLPQRISFGEMGEIVITDVINQGDESTMYFYIDSSFAYDDQFMPNYLDVTTKDGESVVTEYIKAVGPNKYKLSYQNNVGQLYVNTVKIPFMEVEESAHVVLPLN